MKSYRLVLALKSALSESDRKKLLDNVKDWLGSSKIGKTSEWGEREFSYLIKKEPSGYFVELEVEGEKVPSDFEKKLLTSDNVLRHLLLRN